MNLKIIMGTGTIAIALVAIVLPLLNASFPFVKDFFSMRMFRYTVRELNDLPVQYEKYIDHELVVEGYGKAVAQHLPDMEKEEVASMVQMIIFTIVITLLLFIIYPFIQDLNEWKWFAEVILFGLILRILLPIQIGLAARWFNKIAANLQKQRLENNGENKATQKTGL